VASADAVQIRAQGIVGEVLFPQARGELGYVFGGVCTNPLEHVYEVIVGIDALEPAGAQEALDDTQVLGSQFGPTKEPIFPAQRDGADLAFDGIRIYGHVRILQKDLEGAFATVDIRQGFGEGITGQ